MRKQVQKERCTKIMLTKCKAVCCLYDKVQLAAAKMLDNAQKQAILDGREKLDLEVFESAFIKNLEMVSEYISELSAKPIAKRQAKTTPEVSVGSVAPTKIVGNDIRVLLKKAKKCGESPVSAYAEYIKGEVAI